MLKYTIAIPEAVEKLLRTTRELQFGEIFGVEIDPRTRMVHAQVSANERDLAHFIEDGNCYIDVLTVHQSEPVTAELDYENRGFRCRKKIKFPTAKAEG